MRIEKVISWLIRQIPDRFLTFYPEPNARKLMVLRMTVYCMILNTRQHTLLQEEVSERWITDRMLSVHHIIMAPTVPGPHPRQHQNQYPPAMRCI